MWCEQRALFPRTNECACKVSTRVCDYRDSGCTNDGETIDGLWVCRNHLPRVPTAREKAMEAAARKVVARWDGPHWEWDKNTHTGDLIAELRRAVEGNPTTDPDKS